ncbi:hypothetical protein [Runella zeae]|uniref:hypothetical protein n=1 Tax=Runella zeae TaxID=94255 RepID=UPI00048E8CA7|nr:hypothetical protein [Runella zeae]
MRNITNLMDKAETALIETTLVNDGIIKKSKVSAIAGFGAVVINLDLLPALAVYENNHPKIVQALGKIVAPDENSFFAYCKTKITAPNSTLSDKRLLKEQVIDASVALKIMARTFKFDEDEN